MLLRVVAPHFVAGAIWENNQCIAAAPILKWMIGKSPGYVRDYLKRKKWTYQWLK